MKISETQTPQESIQAGLNFNIPEIPQTMLWDEKGSFRNVLNKFHLRGITVLILLSKSVRLHGDRLRRSHIKFIRDAHIGG